MKPFPPPVHDRLSCATATPIDAGAVAEAASDLLNASGALLQGVLALAQAWLQESASVTGELRELLAQIGGAASPGWQPAAQERLAATAALRLLVQGSAERAVRLRRLIGSETISSRFRWSQQPSGATMQQLHYNLELLAQCAAEMGSGAHAIDPDSLAVAQGVAAMCKVAAGHRAVADQSLQTVEQLHQQALDLVGMVARTRTA
jgi:hypothetical protein